MSFAVRFAPAAEDDLLRLFDYLLDHAENADDLARAQGVIDALRHAVVAQLSLTPFSFRKAGDGRSSTRRELIVPAGSSGYVALYEIDSARSVIVLAVRHQREDDYH